jgi:hypothetical protein
VVSLQLGKAEFIGVWLALKVAGQWKRWSEGVRVGEREVDARVFYNIFLIGSGLSIAYSIVGAQLIGAIGSEKWSIAVGLPAALLLGTFAFQKVVIHYQRAAKVVE